MRGIERVLEIAATSRVLRERRLRALDDSPGSALLGREFLHLRALAERCAAETGAAFRVALGPTALARLVAVCAQRSAFFAPLVAERPGFATALSGTIRDLRDAGVGPAALPNEVSDLRALYADVEHALDRLAKDGLLDRVGLFRLAVRGAKAWVKRRGFTRAEVHGATELVGSAGDLVDAIAHALPRGSLRFFQPDWGDSHAERVREAWPWTGFTPEGVELIDRPALTRDGPIPDGTLRVVRTSSPRAEIDWLAREVLALIERGVAPREILIVARTLEPYRAWLEESFDGYRIPVSSSSSRPSIAAPGARVWLDLVRALGGDLERAPVLRFIDAACPREVARLAERLARESAVVRGEIDWRTALDASAPDSNLEALREVLDRLAGARRAFAASGSLAGAASVVLGLGEQLADEAGRQALSSAAFLDAVERAADARPGFEARSAADLLESLLLESSEAWHPTDTGGVQILDAIQARALPCAQLFLIGMVHGAWPRQSAEDPFLADAVRESLRATRRRPVPVRGRALEEERFLLGLLLSQARERVTISFSDADGSGRALSPSGLLRNLPFVERGTDVVGLATSADTDGAVLARRPASVGAAERDFAARIDAFRADDLPFDGCVGAGALNLPETLSPSFVAELGICPLRAWFNSVLRAREVEDPSPDALEANEAGGLAHDALRLLYRRLFDEGQLAPGTPPEAAIARAKSLLPAVLEQAAARARVRVRTRGPELFAAFVALLELALSDFVKRDLRTLLPTGVANLEVEQWLSAEVRLQSGASLSLAGRVDRIVHGPDGTLRVGDYKTSRDFGKPVAPSRVARGTSLQVPAYALAVASARGTRQIVGEALPIPVRPERDRDRERELERSLDLDEIESHAGPVLSEIEGLLERGDFPFHADKQECRYCAYTVACRQAHGPSRERIASSPRFEAWRALRTKTRG